MINRLRVAVLASVVSIWPMADCIAQSTTPTGASAEMKLQLGLIDLTPDDGIAPAITFTGGSTTAFTNIVYYDRDRTPLGSYTVSNQAAGAFAPNSASQQGLDSSVFATASGEILGAGIDIKTAYTEMPPVETFLNGELAFQGSFSLAPGTRAVFYGTIDASASELGNYYVFSEDSAAYVGFYVRNSDGSNNDYFFDLVQANGHGPHSASQHWNFSIYLDNFGTSPSNGIFGGEAVVYGNQIPAIPAPEPTSQAMLLVALAGMGLAMRRTVRKSATA